MVGLANRSHVKNRPRLLTDEGCPTGAGPRKPTGSGNISHDDGSDVWVLGTLAKAPLKTVDTIHTLRCIVPDSMKSGRWRSWKLVQVEMGQGAIERWNDLDRVKPWHEPWCWGSTEALVGSKMFTPRLLDPPRPAHPNPPRSAGPAAPQVPAAHGARLPAKVESDFFNSRLTT